MPLTDHELTRLKIIANNRSLDQIGMDAVDHLRRVGFLTEELNDGEDIALMHSELSEALEAIRNDGYQSRSAKIPDHCEVAEEMADLVIRVAGFCERRGIRLAAAVADKQAYNRTRPAKHGGKAF